MIYQEDLFIAKGIVNRLFEIEKTIKTRKRIDLKRIGIDKWKFLGISLYERIQT